MSSWRLTPYGLAFSLSTVRKDVPEQHDSARSFSLGQAVGHVRGKVLLESQLKAEGRQASPNLHYVKTQSSILRGDLQVSEIAMQVIWTHEPSRES